MKNRQSNAKKIIQPIAYIYGLMEIYLQHFGIKKHWKIRCETKKQQQQQWKHFKLPIGHTHINWYRQQGRCARNNKGKIDCWCFIFRRSRALTMRLADWWSRIFLRQFPPYMQFWFKQIAPEKLKTNKKKQRKNTPKKSLYSITITPPERDGKQNNNE